MGILRSTLCINFNFSWDQRCFQLLWTRIYVQVSRDGRTLHIRYIYIYKNTPLILISQLMETEVSSHVRTSVLNVLCEITKDITQKRNGVVSIIYLSIMFGRTTLRIARITATVDFASTQPSAVNASCQTRYRMFAPRTNIFMFIFMMKRQLIKYIIWFVLVGWIDVQLQINM